MAMWAETCSVEQRQLNVRQRTIYNKAARRRQHNLKTYYNVFAYSVNRKALRVSERIEVSVSPYDVGSLSFVL
jgi:hypothetical protein